MKTSELLIAANTVWVVLAAVLVMFMQAGFALLERLIESAEAAGIWTIEAGIFPENTASIALHARCGFRVVRVRERIAQMQDGTWRDVVVLERRSATP